MKKISGNKLLVKALSEEQVDTIFGYPGACTIDISDELYKQDYTKVILPRQEVALVHEADAYARSTGKVGVCLVTSGPGATNLVTGLATAYYDSVPLVCFTGQVSRHLIGNDAFQEVDIVGITRSITKYGVTVRNREDLGRIIKEAFYIARTGRPGPVLIDLPIDVMAELGSGGSTALKNIVRTIQKEQNAIIRNTKDRIMVIQGAAGSGKTSVALHRIAYLLYHDRQNLKSSNILILSPNGVFSDYISHILPELGEENIKEMSFDLFAYKQLRDTVSDCEDRYDEIERRIRFPQKASLAEEKQSMEFINLMERYLVELEDRLMNFKDVEYKGFVKKESEIIELFYFKFQDFPLLSRMDAVADYFIDEVETLRDRDLADDEKDLIREKFMKLYVTGDLYVIYSQFLKENGYKGLPRVSYEKRKLKYEDVYPVLYLKYRLQSQQGRSNIKHLVVDEMQDYSRLQYEILQRIFSCRMTILGDRAQTMDDKQQDVLKFLPKIFGRDIHKIIMNKSYRNTIEIASYANQLAGIEDMELFERHGAPVEEKIFANMSHAAEEIAETLKLGEEEYETAAVVLRTEKEAEHMWLLLKEILGEKGFDIKERLSYLDRNSTSFKKGLTVTTFYLAKGLEFDQVFAVFPQKDQSPLVRQARYIAATRALHELHMYEVEK